MPQLPLVQVPPMAGHAAPPAVHTELTQQPPPAHAFPAQHASPGAPHTAHTLLRHTVSTAHRFPPQHASPAPPHPRQTPALHVSWLLAHALLAQHGCPGAPQVAGGLPQLQDERVNATQRKSARVIMGVVLRGRSPGRHVRQCAGRQVPCAHAAPGAQSALMAHARQVPLLRSQRGVGVAQ